MIAEKMEEKQYVRLMDFYYQLLYFQITCGRDNLIIKTFIVLVKYIKDKEEILIITKKLLESPHPRS